MSSTGCGCSWTSPSTPNAGIYYRAFEPYESAFFRRVLRPGDIVLDAGANVGYFTLLAAQLVGAEGQVHAFEPVPQNASALAHNVRLNGMANVMLNRVALADRVGTAWLGLEEASVRAGNRGGFTEIGSEDCVRVSTTTLDSYITEELAETRIRLLKIDVEGAEPKLLAGFRDGLRRNRPDVVLVEVSVEMLIRHGWRAEDVTAPLLKAGYELYRLAPFGRLRKLRKLPVAAPIDDESDSNEAVARARRALQQWRALINIAALLPGALERRRFPLGNDLRRLP